MDDAKFGTRDKRDNWTPHEPADVAPIWRLPVRALPILRWIPSYFLPYNVVWAALAVAYWYFVVPEQSALVSFRWSWILPLLLCNATIVLAIYGVLELRLYVLKKQSTRFKYNNNFPADRPSKIFWFKSQNIDNAIRTFCVGVPIWTMLEAIMLWGYANGIGQWINLEDNPAYLFVLALMVPVIHETHFYLIHRLLHTKHLYKWVHSVHHKSNNPSPWSSLSMHPVEHAVYFSSILYHFIIPSNPVIALYQINFAGFGAFVGHIGFHKVELTEGNTLDTHAYIHYLHHKYFEVNYGDGLVPFDKLLGTFHDGTEEAGEAMRLRLRKRNERLTSTS